MQQCIRAGQSILTRIIFLGINALGPVCHVHDPLFFLRTMSETRTSASSIQHSIDTIMFVPTKIAEIATVFMGTISTIPQLILSWSAADAAWQLHTPRSLAKIDHPSISRVTLFGND